jgi:hypothetical protein
LFQPFASSENTVRFCAREDVTPILPPMHPVYEDKLYSVYADVSGKPKGQGVGVLRDVIITDTDAEAMPLWRDSGQFSGRAWFEPFGFRRGMQDPKTGTFPTAEEVIANGYALVGTVDTVLRSMETQQKRQRRSAEGPVHHGRAYALPARRHTPGGLREDARGGRQSGLESRARRQAAAVDDLKYPNWFKEIYLDSDTKVALISGAPSEEPRDWFLTNDMKRDARTKVNEWAGSRRCLSHAIFAPGYPGWMDEVARAIATLKPDSWKGYTVGDNTNKQLAHHPWRMDDEKLVYPFYEKIVKAGYDIVCVHKGLFAPSVAQQFPNLTAYANVDALRPRPQPARLRLPAALCSTTRRPRCGPGCARRHSASSEPTPRAATRLDLWSRCSSARRRRCCLLASGW